MKPAYIFLIIVGTAVIAGLGWYVFFRDGKGLGGAAQDGSGQGGTGDTYVPQFPDDRDEDGIKDSEEAKLGTSDTDFDTDGDGLSDADEIKVWKTDPVNQDSDGDGFFDGLEIIRGYNPIGEGALPQ